MCYGVKECSVKMKQVLNFNINIYFIYMRHKQAVTYYVKSSEFCNFTDSLQNPQNNTYDITSKIHHFLTPCHVFFHFYIKQQLLEKRICFASFCNEVFNLIFRQYKILTLVTDHQNIRRLEFCIYACALSENIVLWDRFLRKLSQMFIIETLKFQ